MKIWRVAHKTAVYNNFPAGPYSNGGEVPRSPQLWTMISAHCDDAHPAPHSPFSGLDFIFDHEHCGFNSREALYDWFATYTGALADGGFMVFIYEVADEYVRVGEFGQVVFDRCAAIEKSRENFDLDPAQQTLWA